MRLFAPALVLSLATAVLQPAPAAAAPSVVASFELDAAPSWQTSDQKAQLGSWAKHSSPVVADLGEGPTILVGSLGGKLYALRYRDGSLSRAWDSGSSIGTLIDSSPAVGDLNGDGCPEIVVGAGHKARPSGSGVHVFDCRGRNHRFWASGVGDIPAHVGVFSTPAIGDVNGDRSPEVAYGSFDQKIYVKDGNGNDLAGWPRQNYDTIWSSPALADIDGGGREVIIGTDLGGGAPALGCAKGTRGTMSIFRANGSFSSGFPKCLNTPIWSTPAVRDLNGDGTLDVVVGTNNYSENGVVVGEAWKVRAWDTRSGRQLWETALPRDQRIFTSPAVGDVGDDGSLDVAVGTIPSSGAGSVFLLDAASGKVRWQRKGSKPETQFMGSGVMADVSGDAKPDVVFASQDGAINAWDASGDLVINDFHARNGQGKNESYLFFNSPAIADLNGDGRNEIVVASAIVGSSPLRGKVWVISSPGRGSGPWPFFKRSAERVSSFGRGTSQAAPTATVPQPIAPSRPARTTPPATTTPTATPGRTEEPTAAPVAFPSEPPVRSTGAKGVLASVAGALALVASGGAVLARRRRAHASSTPT